MPDLKITTRDVEQDGEVYATIISAIGYIDPSTIDPFEKALNDVFESKGGHMLLDLSGLEYINSRAMGLLTSYNTTLQDKGKKLVLTSVNKNVSQLLSLLGILEMVPSRDDVEAGIAFLRGLEAEKPAAVAEPEPVEVPRPEKVRLRPRRAKPVTLPKEINVLLVAPKKDLFAEVLKGRYRYGKFFLAGSSEEGLDILGKVGPDVVILEDTLNGADDFLYSVKTRRRRSVNPIIKIYPRGTRGRDPGGFRIWEDDFLTEPFEMKELYSASEDQAKLLSGDRPIHQVHFDFATTSECLTKASSMTASILEQIESDPGELVALRAAFGEAVDNAARHGNKNNANKRIDVVLRANREKILIRVEDEGDGFAHQAFLGLITKKGDEYMRRQAKRSPSRAEGLGIILMKKTTDALRYIDKGNILELEKKIFRLRK